MAFFDIADGALDPTEFGDSVKLTERDNLHITISHPGFKIQTGPLHVAYIMITVMGMLAKGLFEVGLQGVLWDNLFGMLRVECLLLLFKTLKV